MSLKYKSSIAIASLFATIGFTLPVTASAENILLRQGSFTPPNSPWDNHWNKFKTNIEKNSNGTIDVLLNLRDPNEATLLANLRRGRVECTGNSQQGAATIVPEIALLSAPYLFSSLAEMDYTYDKFVTPLLQKMFAAKGIQLISMVDVGETNMYSTFPIKTPSDLKGVKLRATQSQASQYFLKSVGAEVVPLAIGDTIPSLQTGMIKGGDSGSIVYGMMFAKVAPYFELTRHSYDLGVILCNKAWFDKLTPAQQQAVNTGYTSPEDDARKETRDFIVKLEGTMKEKGITVHQPTADEIKQWREASKDVPQQLAKLVGADSTILLNAIAAGKKEFAAKNK